MRLTVTAAIGLSAALGLAGAGCHGGARTDRLSQRAAFDFGCSAGELHLQKLDDRATEVTGCGKRASYVESCDGLHTSKDTRCTWVRNGKIEVDRRPPPDLDPDPGDVAAPIE